jgi:acyl carrier protein
MRPQNYNHHAEVTNTTRLVDDLGMDSLDLAELFAMIQQETGLRAGAQSLSEFDTVDALAESVLTAAPGAAPGLCPVPAAKGR